MMFWVLLSVHDMEKDVERVREHYIYKLMDYWRLGREEAAKVVDEALKRVLPCVEEERKAQGLE